MTAPIRIRSAESGDSKSLARLSNTLGYPATSQEITTRIKRLSANDQNIILVAIVSDDEMAGWIHGADQELLESGRHCEIFGLVVAPRHRRAGVGCRLIEALAGWANRLELEVLTVRSNVLRSKSHQFYKSMDFEHIKTQHVYRRMIAGQVANNVQNF